MKGSELAKQIQRDGFVQTSTGKQLPLRSATDAAQCEFLSSLVSTIKPEQSVEIGLAYGLSTLYICEALSSQKVARHMVCDPFQFDDVWQGVGVKNIADAGYGDIVQFNEVPGDRMLARMALDANRIQFAYVDADKRFDANLVYFWWLDQMLDVGGILVWDDCDWPALRRVARIIAQHPNYSVHAAHGNPTYSWKRRLVSAAARVHRFGDAGQKAAAVKRDGDLGIDHHCVAFRKTGSQTLNWDWSVDF